MLLIRNIRKLVVGHDVKTPLRGSQMQELPTLEHAFLLVENGRISGFGKMEDAPERADEEIDATGRYVLPTFVDSHTHLVFAATREEEFVMRIKGKSYEEIAAAGGGILNSAKKLQQTSEDQLYDDAMHRLQLLSRLGTGAIEIKSGYGLTVDAELKMLRVIRRLRENSPLLIKATFLGAHAFPAEFKQDHEGYINLLIKEMLPQIAGERLADYIDVFCERNYFSVDEMNRILEAGSKYGLKPKVHVNQFSVQGAIPAAVSKGAVSVDHLEVVDPKDIEALQINNTIATLLPSCSFFLSIPYAPARQLIDSNVPVALASDYNPGSTPNGNMQLVISLGCIKQKMLPEEAVNAATINGAFAMEAADEVGSLAIGKRANFIVTKPMENISYLPYSFGEDKVESIFINGKKI